MFVLNEVNSIANQFLAELRDIKIQKDPMRFRKNIERIGEILAYELSKSLQYSPKSITTPLAETTINLIDEQPILVPILRAGLPLFQGVLNYFDGADAGFIGACRKESDGENQFDIQLDYLAAPSLEGKHIILIDPMLASGKSMVKTVNALKQHGNMRHIDILCLIAAPEGINYIRQHINESFDLWVGGLDEKLNDRAYIIPGLGDAGDLCFGHKI